MKGVYGTRALALILFICMLPIALIACELTDATERSEDIFIIFTGDVHCADDEAIGYAGLKSYVDATKKKSPHVTLVDTGDAVWGDFLGNNSEGEYIIDLMNSVGYDIAVLGNHEFDYGMVQLGNLMKRADATYIGCNISYTGKGENPISALKPYIIKEFGGTKVAFIGVSTPDSITDSTPTNFMEDGEFVFDFGHTDAEKFYTGVQSRIDACRAEGADHVILLTHLGDGEEYAEFSSEALISATAGADAVLDGHAHSTIPCRMVENKAGDAIPLSSTGTGLENIGQLVISPSGNISISLINGDVGVNASIEDKIEAENQKVEGIMSEVVGVSDFTLPTHDEGGERIVRNRETALGNLCADAYRASTGADIAIINGGGLRAPLTAGDITFSDIMALHPYGNNICVVYATGQEIADALEFSARFSELDENGIPCGENGGFLQVSGLKYTIDTSIPSSVRVDENGLFSSVGGERRVCDIMVEGKDGYVALDMDKTYTLASFNYTLQQCGDGYSMFADNDYAVSLGKFDYETLIDYIRSFEGGKIPQRYSDIEGRITIK